MNGRAHMTRWRCGGALFILLVLLFSLSGCTENGRGGGDTAEAEPADAVEKPGENRLTSALTNTGSLPPTVQASAEAEPAVDMTDPDALAIAGEQFLAAGRYEEAVRAYQRSLELYPEGEDVHYNLAITFTRMGKGAEAVRHYEKAIEIAPDYAEAHNNLGNLLVRMGRIEEAIGHFREAIEINPGHASSYNNLGTALARQKNYFDAISQFGEAVALDPGYIEARFNLGSAFMSAGMLEDAEREFRETLRLQPDFQPAQLQMARIARQRSVQSSE